MHNLNGIISKTKKLIKENAPTILTCVGIFGMGVAIVEGSRATIKSKKKIDEKVNEISKEEDIPKDEVEISKKEIVKSVWKNYIPTAATFVMSTVCISKANSINIRRNAALAAAYNITRSAYDEYRSKVIDVIGEKKEKAIKESMSQDKVNNNPPSTSKIFVTGRGETLFYDACFEQYFKCDIVTIREAVAELKSRMVTDMYVSLNDFYSEIGVKPIGFGDDIGWNVSDGYIEVSMDAMIAPSGSVYSGTPCIVIDYNLRPKELNKKLCY